MDEFIWTRRDGTRTRLSIRDLNTVMEFDCPVRVDADGVVHDDVPGLSVPELFDGELSQPPVGGPEWEFFTNGYTGQYGYSGPIMHDSEFIGGRLARDILAQPGFYVALVNYSTAGCECGLGECEETEEPEGWAVAFKSE